MWTLNSNVDQQTHTDVSDAIDDMRYTSGKDKFQLIEQLKESISNREWPEEDGIADLMALAMSPTPGTDVFGGLTQENSAKWRRVGGEFYTPTLVCEHLMLQVVDGLKSADAAGLLPREIVVIEPSCGTGSIALAYLRVCAKLAPSILARTTLVLNDLNWQAIQLAEMNFDLAARLGLKPGKLVVHHGNAFETLTPYLGQAHAVIGNPPFGKSKITMQESLFIQVPCRLPKPKGINFVARIGHENEREGRPVEMATAFTELAVGLTALHGLIAFVISNSYLSNKEHEASRRHLMERTRIIAVSDLPKETFLFSGTSCKCSELVAVRDFEPDRHNYSIMMSIISSIGWDSRGRETPCDFLLPEAEDFLSSVSTELQMHYGQYVEPAIKSA